MFLCFTVISLNLVIVEFLILYYHIFIFIAICVLLYGLPVICVVSKVQVKKSLVLYDITRSM